MSKKPLLIYLIIISVLAVLLHLFLKNYSALNYSGQKKELLISSPSKFKLNNGDPCTHSIYGDPVDVGENYIKINLHCGINKSSTNTLDLKGISPDNYLGAINLLASVNLFKAGVIPQRIDQLGDLKSENNEWRCYIGMNQEIENFNNKLKPNDTINCFYKFSDEQIKKHYETS